VKILLALIISLLSWNTFASFHKIEITGNNRTQDKLIKFVFNRCLEQETDPVPEIRAIELAQCVMNERIFHDVKVRKTKEGWHLEVKERWTLIPIPRFEADTAGNKYYGLGVVESNLFGLRIVLFAEFLTGTINQFKIFYIDPSFLLTNHIFRFKFNIDDNEIVEEFEAERVNGFQESELGFNIGLGYDWGKSILTALFDYSKKDYEQLYDYPVPDPYWKFYFGLTYFYDDRDFKISYNEGFSFILRALLEMERSDNTRAAHQFTGIGNYTMQAFWDHVFRITGQLGMTTTDDQRDAFKLGRSRGFRGTLQYSIWAQHFYGLIFGYDVPIMRWSFGTWTFGLFSDLTRIKNVNDLGYTNFFSGGVGTYIYLKKLAIPGFGIEYGWQNQKKDTFFALNVGIGF